MKFRKRPVVVEAVQYTGHNADEIFRFAGESVYKSGGDGDVVYLHIITLEGTLSISVGDWIIKGIKGEFYPCKPDIFAEIHEPADGVEIPAAAKVVELKRDGTPYLILAPKESRHEWLPVLAGSEFKRDVNSMVIFTVDGQVIESRAAIEKWLEKLWWKDNAAEVGRIRKT